MKFYEELIISDKIELTKEEFLNKLYAEETFFHTYLIVVPLFENDNQLEFFHIELAKQELYDIERYLIVGIALGKSDAKEMVHQIIHKVYEETGNTDIRSYFITDTKG